MAQALRGKIARLGVSRGSVVPSFGRACSSPSSRFSFGGPALATPAAAVVRVGPPPGPSPIGAPATYGRNLPAGQPQEDRRAPSHRAVPAPHMGTRAGNSLEARSGAHSRFLGSGARLHTILRLLPRSAASQRLRELRVPSSYPAPNPTPGLSIRGVRKHYRNSEVLGGVDLEIAPGEVVALLGPNGAGKSTLLRIIVGTVAANAGDVIIGGHDMRRDPLAARAAVSWVLGDEHGWYWRLTGIENLTFFGMLRGMDHSAARARARAELEHQDLEHAANQRLGEYSTGMRARLALARANLIPTAAMVLDEPGRGLDAPANERLVAFLRSLESTAVLVVTHDLEMASRIAGRSLVLREGVVREQFAGGTPAEILATGLVDGP
ncbi:MAG: ABC transporter ATP-binding protein [Actinobacteria bacterium]|nr:MAG: ABC transporter ATP-binding protein [Actinomycetota bacterium]